MIKRLHNFLKCFRRKENLEAHSWIDVITYFLEQESYNFLWYYITALRSSDEEENYWCWKLIITCLLRGKKIGLYGQKIRLYISDISLIKTYLEDKTDNEIDSQLYANIPSQHFLSHSTLALSALAVYYREAKCRKDIAILLNKLSNSIAEKKKFSKTVREIVRKLYDST